MYMHTSADVGARGLCGHVALVCEIQAACTQTRDLKSSMALFNCAYVGAGGLCSMLHPSANCAGNRAKHEGGDCLVVRTPLQSLQVPGSRDVSKQVRLVTGPA